MTKLTKKDLNDILEKLQTEPYKAEKSVVYVGSKGYEEYEKILKRLYKNQILVQTLKNL